jgi:hypothetical protein
LGSPLTLEKNTICKILRLFSGLAPESAMHTAFESAGVGTRRVRALVTSDRHSAHEQRSSAEPVVLQTTEYKVPLKLRLKRSFREDDRVRIGSLIASAGLVIALVGTVVSALGTARASQDQERGSIVVALETTRVRSTLLPISYEPPAMALDEVPASAPGRDRLQRARQLLRASGAEGTAQARRLLEELLRARPKHGRAYAALAEACLRLADSSCARAAVSKAVARQPRRAKYKALAERIERAFAPGQE